MIHVKICGLTDPRDAALAAELGAAAIGMIFWPSSPRQVDTAKAREILAALPAGVDAVGVFVNDTRRAADVAGELGLAAVQLHGDEQIADYADFPVPVIKAVGVRGEATVAEANAIPAAVTVLLDAHDPVKRGGTGSVVDWTVAAAIARGRRILLSGGLTPANIATAIEAVQPYGVDVSSGVESAPGKKDQQKMRALFDAVRRGNHGQ